MSLEQMPNGDWRVRWRQGGRNRAQVIGPRKADAITFEQELKRAKRMGTLAQMQMGTDRFEDFVADEYWPKHAALQSAKHQHNQESNVYAYLFPRFADHRLSEITRSEIEGFLGELQRKGVGGRAQQTIFQTLKTILNKAVDWDKLAANPANRVAKPKHVAKPIVPPTPLEVERVREQLFGMDRQGDAVLVSVLAYGGLRPNETWDLTWDDIRDHTILVGDTKRGLYRSVDIWKPLATDLAEWKLATGGKHHLVFPNRSGNAWTETDWRNWRSRVWFGCDYKGRRPDNPKYSGKGGVGVPGRTPYALRHTHSSLMIREDKLTIAEQAAQAGHSIEVHLSTYAHLFSELKGKGSAEDAIRAARMQVSQHETEAM